ncbi:hypothetical protein KCP76_02645 [Salmonella enterica subsp. enterica serovar Weltevreden]|nr:hypothetical protein KCP76_02645 [Salmonella enterica subsp. enterica serovar Weltevreden]
MRWCKLANVFDTAYPRLYRIRLGLPALSTFLNVRISSAMLLSTILTCWPGWGYLVKRYSLSQIFWLASIPRKSWRIARAARRRIPARNWRRHALGEVLCRDGRRYRRPAGGGVNVLIERQFASCCRGRWSYSLTLY